MFKNKKDISEDLVYDNYIHKVGRVTLSVGFLASMLPPLMLWMLYGIFPPVKNLLNGILSITSLMLPVSIVEVLTFAPILGAGAIYMSYLTGNISNMKIPSAAIAIDVVGVTPYTKEGDIIANLAIAGSVLAGEFIVIIGVILVLPLSKDLNNPIIKPAFEQILPALFGALGAYYFLKEWKLAVAPVILAILLNLFMPSLPTSLTIPICVGASILAAKILYKKGQIKTNQRVEVD